MNTDKIKNYEMFWKKNNQKINKNKKRLLEENQNGFN